jgi:predicted CopG family antitoxin
MTQLMSKRIPVSEERWKELGKMKEAGQTYDDLMRELIQARNRLELASKMDAADRGEGTWFSLDEI